MPSAYPPSSLPAAAALDTFDTEKMPKIDGFDHLKFIFPAASAAGSEPLKLAATLCHGMVKQEDFERLVPSHWWKTVFADSLYLKTDGDVVEDAEITKEEIRMLESNGRISQVLNRPGAKVLDLCCGQGRHSILLAERFPALNVFGHDQSSYLISLARERALNLPPSPLRSSPPLFTVGDCRTVPFDSNNFDFVMIMGNSFGYFSANDSVETSTQSEQPSSPLLGHGDHGDRAVLKEINRCLNMGGHMVLDLADGDYMRENFSPRSWEWIDHQTFACRERVLSKDKKRLHSREVVVSVSRGVVRDQFYSERLYGRTELMDLLKEAGFEVETKDADADDGVDTVTTAREMSQRGQDLGMMEQRILMYAKKVQQHPRALQVATKIQAVSSHPFMSAENVQAVREWLDRLSPDTPISSSPTEVSNFSPEYIELLRVWIGRLKENLFSTGLLASTDSSMSVGPGDDTNAIIANTDFNPAIYHLLPAPPFPNDQLAVIMGDTSISCREKLNGNWNAEDFDTRKRFLDGLLACGYTASQITVFESHKELLGSLVAHRPMFTLNLCDEGFMNNALKELHVPAVLEMLNIPYSGAGPLSLGICYDKGLTNSTAAKLGVPTPKETFVVFADSVDCKDIRIEDIERIVIEKELLGDILYPAFVKPMKGDNSLGITGRSIVHNRTDLSSYLESLIQSYGLKEFLVQEYLRGTEYSVGMIGNPESGFHFFPILQVDYSKVIKEGLEPILGWESKWDPLSPYWNDIDYFIAPRIPTEQAVKDAKKIQEHSGSLQTGGLSMKEEEALKQHCITLFERFGCRDYARFDWRADCEILWSETTGSVQLRRPDSAYASEPSNSPLDGPSTSVPSISVVEPIQKLTLSTLPVDINRTSFDQDSNSNAIEENSTISSSDSHSRVHESIVSDSGHGSIRSNDDNPRAFRSSEPLPTSKAHQFRKIKLLEINPNPGWCWDGKLAKMAAFEGKSYPDLLKSVLWASWERIYGRQLRLTPVKQVAIAAVAVKK